MKLFTKQTKSSNFLSDRECRELADRINELTEQLGNIRANFNIVTDDRTIDALIYEENALICRIEALHREARERGLKVQPFQR